MLDDPNQPAQGQPQGVDYLGNEASITLDNKASLPVGGLGGPASGGGQAPTIGGGGMAAQQSDAQMVEALERAGIDPVQLAIAALGGGGSALSLAGQLFKPDSIVGEWLGIQDPSVSQGLGTAGATAGTAAGLAGAGLAASEGQVPEAILGGLQGAGGLASLIGSFTPGAAVGGVPLAGTPGITGLIAEGLGLTGAGAAGAGAGAAGAGAAGAGGAAGGASAGATGGAAAGASLAAALSAVLAPVAIGIMLDPLWRHLDLESLDARNERRNNAAIAGLAQPFMGALRDAETPGDLLGLAGIGPGYGQGQIQFVHDRHGFGGDYDDPMSPEFLAALEAASADPAALRDFISGINVNLGHTGSLTKNFGLTDFYRRELAGQAGITDPTGLFDPTPPEYLPSTLANKAIGGDLWQYGGSWDSDPTRRTIEDMLGEGLSSYYVPLGPGAGYLPVPVSHRFRSPGELQVPENLRFDLGQALEAINRDRQQRDVLTQDWTQAGIGGDGGGDGGAAGGDGGGAL